ncbi:hypothetical protein [Desulfosporosinus fructosivorans]
MNKKRVRRSVRKDNTVKKHIVLDIELLSHIGGFWRRGFFLAVVLFGIEIASYNYEPYERRIFYEHVSDNGQGDAAVIRVD